MPSKINTLHSDYLKTRSTTDLEALHKGLLVHITCVLWDEWREAFQDMAIACTLKNEPEEEGETEEEAFDRQQEAAFQDKNKMPNGIPNLAYELAADILVKLDKFKGENKKGKSCKFSTYVHTAVLFTRNNHLRKNSIDNWKEEKEKCPESPGWMFKREEPLRVSIEGDDLEYQDDEEARASVGPDAEELAMQNEFLSRLSILEKWLWVGRMDYDYEFQELADRFLEDFPGQKPVKADSVRYLFGKVEKKAEIYFGVSK